MDLLTWVGRYLRHEEHQRPGFTVTSDLWNDLWNLIIQQGDYNTATLTELITEFFDEKTRTAKMLIPASIKGGTNVSVITQPDNSVVINAMGDGQAPEGFPNTDQVNSMINNAVTEYNTSTVDVIKGDLQAQIDGKVNTYYQDDDPATVWNTTPLKEQHTGDLWYKTSLQKSYRWSGSIWVGLVDKDATDAKTLAQSKAQVFTSEPVPPYNVGDLWNNELGLLLYCVTSKSLGTYDSADWSVAYSQLVNEVNTLGTRTTSTEAAIIQSNVDIGLRVTQAQYTTDQMSVSERISAAEEKITPEAITSTVTQSTEYQLLAVNLGENTANIADIQTRTQENTTAIEQTSNQIEFRFNDTTMQLDTLAGIVDDNRAVIEEYIRFTGALIQLGRIGNDFTAELDNTKLAFKQNGAEIAYISNHKMYITDTEIKNKLTIGRAGVGYFDIILKDNGNLATKWRNS